MGEGGTAANRGLSGLVRMCHNMYYNHGYYPYLDSTYAPKYVGASGCRGVRASPRVSQTLQGLRRRCAALPINNTNLGPNIVSTLAVATAAVAPVQEGPVHIYIHRYTYHDAIGVLRSRSEVSSESARPRFSCI